MAVLRNSFSICTVLGIHNFGHSRILDTRNRGRKVAPVDLGTRPSETTFSFHVAQKPKITNPCYQSCQRSLFVLLCGFLWYLEYITLDTVASSIAEIGAEKLLLSTRERDHLRLLSCGFLNRFSIPFSWLFFSLEELRREQDSIRMTDEF